MPAAGARPADASSDWLTSSVVVVRVGEWVFGGVGEKQEGGRSAAPAAATTAAATAASSAAVTVSRSAPPSF